MQIAIVPGLQGVVEGDDGAATGVFHHIGKYLGPAEFLAVVARDNIPHHDAVVVAQHDVLLPAHPAVGRTEQAGVQHLVGFIVLAFLDQLVHQQGVDAMEGHVHTTGVLVDVEAWGFQATELELVYQVVVHAH